MNVKFKNSTSNIVYKVIHQNVIDFDEVIYKQYMEGYILDVIGFVPKELLIETEAESNSIDILIELTTKIKNG